MRKAFTLAEVLITLGIIGVVATLTIPILIERHQKSVVETRLKKFYSVMNQALNMSLAQYGEIEFDKANINENNRGEYLDKWMDKYILSQVKGIKKPINGSYVKRYLFNDGSGFAAYTAHDFSKIHFFFCIKSAQSCTHTDYDGKNSFLFEYSPSKRAIVPQGYNINDINRLKYEPSPSNRGCYTETKDTCCRHLCTRLIEINGWKIPDDYPWLK